MEPAVFYADPSTIADNCVTLSRQESHHAVKVLRLTRGDLVVVADGLGTAYRGAISKIGRGGIVDVNIHSQTRNFGEPNVVLTLAGGLSTGQKFDLVVEKGTELGVKRFVPLITEKSTVKAGDAERLKRKVLRWEKVALAAMKQCRRSYRPEICSPVRFDDYLREIDAASLNLIFHPSASSTSFADVKFDPGIKRVNILVGPESGFSREEIAMAVDKKAIAVSLGSRILRTETAGPAVCALVMDRLGELR